MYLCLCVRIWIEYAYEHIYLDEGVAASLDVTLNVCVYVHGPLHLHVNSLVFTPVYV